MLFCAFFCAVVLILLRELALRYTTSPSIFNSRSRYSTAGSKLVKISQYCLARGSIKMCLGTQYQFASAAYISAVLHPLHPGEHLPGVPTWAAYRWPKLRGTEGPEGKCGLSVPFVKQLCQLALIIYTISTQISSRILGPKWCKAKVVSSS